MKYKLLFLTPFATSNTEGKTFRNLLALVVVVLGMGFSWGQLSINSLPASYSNNFDSYNPTSSATATSTLISTGTGSGLVSATSGGWAFTNASGAAYSGRGTGTINTGGIWAYGSSGEYAIGMQRSGSNEVSFTVSFTNNSGSTITSLTIAWDYEQWRFGGNTSGINVTGTGALSSNVTLNGKDFIGTSSGTSGTVAVTNISSFTLTGLSIADGTSFGMKWITVDASGSDNGIGIDNFSITAAASSNSTASDIITQSGYSYTSNIDYASKQTASSLTTANSVGVNGLTLRDGGVTTDTDALGTTLTDVTFSTGGSTAIRTAALFDGPNKIAEVAVNGATSIVFSGLSLSATDGGTKDFELRVTYQSSVTDNQQIIYTVSSATASASTSSFTAANAGAAASSATGDNNRIEVTVSVLVFSQQPTDVNTNVSMSPAVTVTAKDTNNNNDLDFTDTIRVSSTGTMTGSPVSVAAVNGVATFSSLTHTNTGTGLTLLAERNNSGSWDLDVTSNPFSVAVVSTATDYFRSLATGSWASPSSWESSADNINWINATLTPTSNANVISIRNGHTVTINATVTVDEVNVLSGGVLTASAVMTVNNGSGDDITVEPGARVNYMAAPVYSSSVIRIKTGGIVSIQVSGMTSAGTGVNASTHIYEDGSILEYNLVSQPSSSNVTYFPNVTTEIPIFRFAQTIVGNIGSVNPTVINGRVELASGVSISWAGDGTKTFRNGVVGLGGLNTMSTASGTGVWNISGTTAQLGTNGGTSLTLNNTNGIAISGATTATVVGNLNIGTTTNLTVAASGTLNTGGFLTFKSDANGTASLGNSAGTITGNVTVERYIPAGKRAFRLLSPAVTTSNYILNNWQQQTHITGGLGTTGLGFDATATNNPSMFTFDNQATSGSGWASVANTNATNLIAGTGYRVLIRGNRSVDLTAPSADAMNAAVTLSATGTLRTGSITLDSSSSPSINNTTYNAGFSLVGNPYQSPIDWNAVTKSGIEATYYAWDPNMGTTSQRGRYVSFNGSVNNVVDGDGRSSNVGQFIQPGQAFFVKNTGSGAGSLTFDEADKVATNANVFRTANPTTLTVSLYDPNELAIAGYPIDAMKAVFSADYTNDMGLGDAIKLEASGENMAWYRNATKLVIDAAAPLTSTDELAMKTIRLGANKNYTLKINTTNFDATLTPYLVDNYLNTQTEISTAQAHLATFNTTDILASFGEDRFKIVFQPSVLSTDDFANGLVVYPNPAKAGANFYVQGITTAQVTVYNVLGQHIPVQVKSQGNALQVTPMQTLSQGIYLVTVTTEGKTQHVKWIVE